MLPAGDRRWAEALAAFDEVVDLEGPARQARLQVIGSTDPELQLAVERLLAADSRAGAMLVHLDGDPGDETVDADPFQLVGRTVSHFRIVEAIARGGMARRGTDDRQRPEQSNYRDLSNAPAWIGRAGIRLSHPLVGRRLYLGTLAARRIDECVLSRQ